MAKDGGLDASSQEAEASAGLLDEVPSHIVRPSHVNTITTGSSIKDDGDDEASQALTTASINFDDLDSDDLEKLEDQADEEDEDDADLDILISQAAALYPPDKIESLVEELKEQGISNFLKAHVVDDEALSIPHLLVALGVLVPKSYRDSTLTPRKVQVAILKAALDRLLQRRAKLPQYNTVDDALTLLRTASPESIIVLSGAGISTSCGIPDFRSKDGIYARLQESGQYDLDDPQDMFDKELFLYRPELFYSFAREIFPSNFTPSPSHRFIRLLETRGLLLRNYTQNIDTLETKAGIQRVLPCHGSFATASCVSCAYRCDGKQIEEDIFAQRVPDCPECDKRRSSAKREKESQQSRSSGSSGGGSSASKKKQKKKKQKHDDWQADDSDADSSSNGASSSDKRTGILRPDITFFGDPLTADFDRCLASDREKASLLLVMGTSLEVAPVSSVVGHLPHSVPVVLINRTPIVHIGVDLMLLGDADVIVAWLCRKLGWQAGGESSGTVASLSDAELDAIVPTQWNDSHVWLFPGADLGPLEDDIMSTDEGDSEDLEEGEGDDGGEEKADDQGVAEKRRQRSPKGEAGSGGAGKEGDGENGEDDERETKRSRVE